MTSNPQWNPGWALGYIPSAAEWNAAFGQKQDSGAPAAVSSSGSVTVQSATTNAPPSPNYGDLPFLVGSSPTGAWTGHASKLAFPNYQSSGWQFFNLLNTVSYAAQDTGIEWNANSSGALKASLRIYTSNGAYSTPQQAAAVVAQFTNAVLIVDSNFEFTATDSSSFKNIIPIFEGGVWTIDNGVTITLKWATSNGKAFNCIGTGRILFNTPLGAINTAWFCDPTASPSADFTASIAGTTMTVSAVATAVPILATQTIYDGSGAVTGGTTILSQLTGSAGSTGTYQVSISQTVTSRVMASAYDCYNDLVAAFNSWRSPNMFWVMPPLLHHTSQPLPFPGLFTPNAVLFGYGTTIDHALSLTGYEYKLAGLLLDAALNPVPVGQAVSGIQQVRGLLASVRDVQVQNFPEHGISFGTNNAVQQAGNQVVTTLYENFNTLLNGAHGIFANPNPLLAPRAWCNLNHFVGCAGQNGGGAGLYLDGQSIENDFTGFHAEGNNTSVGFGLTTVVGSFLGGDIITGQTSGATASVSRTSANEMIAYNWGGLFQQGETIIASYNGASAVIANFSGLVQHTSLGSATGTFLTFETITGLTSGVTAQVGDWDPTPGVFGGTLTLYTINGAFTSGETIQGSTSGATATVNGDIVRIAFGVTSDYIVGEGVTDTTTGATAVVQYWDTRRRLLFVTNITGGAFSNGDTIVGSESGASGVINGLFGASFPFGGNVCRVLGLSGISGTFQIDEVVIGSASGVTGRPIILSGVNMGLRGVNANGLNFMFQVGETITGKTSLATGTVATSELGGGWSSNIYIASGSNSFHGGLTVDSVGARYTIDCSAGGGPGTTWFGGRVVGALNGQPAQFLPGSFASGAHRATGSESITVNTTNIFVRRITVTSGMSPITLLATDQLVDILNNSSAAVELDMPAVPGNNQQITVQDVKNNAGTFPITLKSGATTLDTIQVNGGASNVRYWKPTTSWLTLAS